MDKNFEKKYQEDLKKIKSLKLFDDDFMTIVFDGFNEGVELILHTILDKKDIEVISVSTVYCPLSSGYLLNS